MNARSPARPEGSGFPGSGSWLPWRRPLPAPDHRAALILIAGGGGGHVGAIEAVSGWSDYTPIPETDPSVVELNDVNLYESGLTARRLPQARRALRLLSSSDAMRLRAVDRIVFRGLSEENGRSAELGLALALLMLERPSP